MRLSIAIQHHPLRAELVKRLLADLPTAELVADPDPDAPMKAAWRAYAAALERTPSDATHRLIIQDDAQVCRSFLPALRDAIAAKPGSLLVLCTCGNATLACRGMDIAVGSGSPWVRWPHTRPPSWVQVVAVVWPTSAIGPALEWVAEARTQWPREFLADDEIVGRAVAAIDLPVLATVPSLVHHDDCAPSLVGQKSKCGGNPARVTHRYVGDGDPLELDWEAEPSSGLPLFARP